MFFSSLIYLITELLRTPKACPKRTPRPPNPTTAQPVPTPSKLATPVRYPYNVCRGEVYRFDLSVCTRGPRVNLESQLRTSCTYIQAAPQKLRNPCRRPRRDSRTFAARLRAYTTLIEPQICRFTGRKFGRALEPIRRVNSEQASSPRPVRCLPSRPGVRTPPRRPRWCCRRVASGSSPSPEGKRASRAGWQIRRALGSSETVALFTAAQLYNGVHTWTKIL